MKFETGQLWQKSLTRFFLGGGGGRENEQLHGSADLHVTLKKNKAH